MPTYEYKCNDCETQFEETHGVDEKAERCPRCGGKVRRVFHPVGIIFKGSGFYKTDSRSVSDNGGGKSIPEKPEVKPAKSDEKVSGDKKEPAKKSEAGTPS